MKKLFVFLAVAIVIVALAGCSVNTKLIERERVDQEIGGNRGYLMGTPPAETGGTERRTTKKYYEVQVEFPVAAEDSRVPKKTVEEESSPAPEINYVLSEQGAGETDGEAREEFTNYTVQKGETLQKISMKFFGTTKKWKHIFDANRDTLKSPDKVRPGMTLKIPKLEGMKAKESEYIK